MCILFKLLALSKKIKEGKGTLFAGRKGMKKNKLLEQNKFLGKLFVKKSYR